MNIPPIIPAVLPRETGDAYVKRVCTDPELRQCESAYNLMRYARWRLLERDLAQAESVPELRNCLQRILTYIN